MIYNIYIYIFKVLLRDMPRGVAQDRIKNHTAYIYIQDTILRRYENIRINMNVHTDTARRGRGKNRAATITGMGINKEPAQKLQ